MTCIPCRSCGSCNPCTCNPCVVVTTGCPIQLDTSCILYHKSNSEITELDGLNISNGATLELILETIDEKIKQLNVIDLNLPCLRQTYVINTLQQFIAAVDTELCLIKDRLDILED